METLYTFRRTLRRFFEEAQMPDPEYDAMALLSDSLSMSFTQIHIEAQMALSDDIVCDIKDKAQRVAKGEPLQYVTGKAYFGGREFRVDPNVLIPRPETYELVQKVCAAISSESERVLDIGTGSGCIALSISAEKPQARVRAVDISEGALAVAQSNNATLGTSVQFGKCDILNEMPQGEYDIVVSNPPYVRESEKAEMLSLVLDHEPHLALFVPDNDPLVFYRTIAQRCVSGLLCRGGKLFFEINEALAAEMTQMLTNEGFADIEVWKDAYGKDRMVVATLRG